MLRFSADAAVPVWATRGLFTSITRTEEELSIVCPLDAVPPEQKKGEAWVCFKLQGPFPFSEVGVLASFIEPLARNGVPIFAIATYDTDYVLVHESSAVTALKVLRDAGHHLFPVTPEK